LAVGGTIPFGADQASAVASCGTLTDGSFAIKCTVEKDDPKRFEVRICSAGLNPNFLTPFDFHYEGKWLFDATGLFANPDFADETVFLTGFALHLVHPDPGDIIAKSFSIRFSRTASWGSGTEWISGLVPHLVPHFDKYRANQRVAKGYGTPFGSRITDYRFNLFASHIPEPRSWALMVAGFGLIGAALRGSRRSDRLYGSVPRH
jgi:hypothetical protein